MQIDKFLFPRMVNCLLQNMPYYGHTHCKFSGDFLNCYMNFLTFNIFNSQVIPILTKYGKSCQLFNYVTSKDR